MRPYKQPLPRWQRTVITGLVVFGLFAVAFLVGAVIGPRLLGTSGSPATVAQQSMPANTPEPAPSDATNAWHKPEVDITLKGTVPAPSGDTQAVLEAPPADGNTDQVQTPDDSDQSKPAAGSAADALKPATGAQGTAPVASTVPAAPTASAAPAAPAAPIAPAATATPKPAATTKPVVTSGDEAGASQWFKVRIGPFGSSDLAKESRKELKSKGIDAMLVGKLHLQAGAFKTRAGAEKLKQQLEELGYPATIITD